MTKYNEAQRKHIAEIIAACGGGLVAAHERLRMDKDHAPPSLATICGWIQNNIHHFTDELEQARQRAQRFEYGKAIAVAERMVRSIRSRVATWRFEHEKCFQAQAQRRKGEGGKAESDPEEMGLSKAAEINSALIRLETHLRQSTEYLLCLKHPKEGDVAKEAVDRFVRMLLTHATPEQREAVAAVTQKLLSEGAE